jgi:hypothetical protein
MEDGAEPQGAVARPQYAHGKGGEEGEGRHEGRLGKGVDSGEKERHREIPQNYDSGAL